MPEAAPTPHGLHHLAGNCVLHGAGTLLCAKEWFQPVPGVPKLKTLTVWPAGLGHCGLDHDGGIVCIEQSGIGQFDDAFTATLSEGIERVDGDIVVSKTGVRYLAARRVVDGHSKFELEPLTAFEGYTRIIPRPTLSSGFSGWIAIGSQDSTRVQAWADCGRLETCLNNGSSPLPMLDGLDDIEDVATIYGVGGCMLRAHGRVECWDAEGDPTARRHAADGDASQLVASDLEPHGSGICALTRDAIVCEDFSRQETHTIPLPGVRELSEVNGRLCALADDPGVVCLRAGLREDVPAASCVGSLSDGETEEECVPLGLARIPTDPGESQQTAE